MDIIDDIDFSRLERKFGKILKVLVELPITVFTIEDTVVRDFYFGITVVPTTIYGLTSLSPSLSMPPYVPMTWGLSSDNSNEP